MNENDSFLRKARKTVSEVDWDIRIGDYEIKFPTGSKLRGVVIREVQDIRISGKFRIIWPTRNHFGEL